MDRPYSILEDPNLRPNVGIMLINRENQILAGEAIHYPGEWMMPQGGIDPEESPHEAMQRELREETTLNYSDVQFLAEAEDWISYCFRQPLVKEGKLYTGQRQKWFLLEYNGEAPNAEAAMDREFIQFRWVDKAWLLTHTTTFKVQVYESIFAEFETNPGLIVNG